MCVRIVYLYVFKSRSPFNEYSKKWILCNFYDFLDNKWPKMEKCVELNPHFPLNYFFLMRPAVSVADIHAAKV
jgi:hypothetical protein